MDFSNRQYKCTSYLCLIVFIAFLSNHLSESARLTHAVMMSVPYYTSHFNCTDRTITQKNQTSSVILTGTVINYNDLRSPSQCSLQVWRIMKGKKLAMDLLNVQETGMLGRYKTTYVDIYGLRNPAYCESTVRTDDTRIFFLNRVDDRLVLSASLLRITLTNLHNTQDVVDGKKIVEVPKKPRDPCLLVLCGYEAHCTVVDGSAKCVCPELACGYSQLGDDVFSPVCGSDGVTYPNECELRGAQCIAQKAIVVASNSACVPVVDRGPCTTVTCGYGAVCELVTDPSGETTPSCVCPSCEDEAEEVVCGSDRKDYSSECALRRSACLERKNVTVVRRSRCDPCQVFTDDLGNVVATCSGECLHEEGGRGVCCSAIQCQEDDTINVCGSDGNTYESECALKRYACKTARSISVLQPGRCPNKRGMTTVTGSVAIEADENCPGGCDTDSIDFDRFLTRFQLKVNEMLGMQNDEDDDGRVLNDFRVTGTRPGSLVLLYKLFASVPDLVITANHDVGEESAWIYRRLYDEVDGAVRHAIVVEDVTPVDDMLDYMVVDDVCLDMQCEHGSVCSIKMDGGRFVPRCSCDGVGDGSRLGVNMPCMRGSDGLTHDLIFANTQEVRMERCLTRSFYVFKNVCSDSTAHSCDDITCDVPGQVCELTNGVARCGCVTCDDDDEPICGSDGTTYRSSCDLRRWNCLNGGDVIAVGNRPCDNLCGEMECPSGQSCEVGPQGAHCVCNTVCLEVYSPVCGTDCTTYSNNCYMESEACTQSKSITVLHHGPCEDGDQCGIEGSGMEGSGEASECGCKFGAVCEGTMDDEDAICVCSFHCDNSVTQRICGSNGVTYMNECERKQAECEQQKSIPVVRSGPCQESCDCNVHGSYDTSCNVITGQCKCRPGVGGLRCDRCKPGFWNFHALVGGESEGCTACGCHGNGSTRDDCDQMTGDCSCKEGVRGWKCGECDDGSPVTNELCRVTTRNMVVSTTHKSLPISTTVTTTSPPSRSTSMPATHSTTSTTPTTPKDDIESSGSWNCEFSDDEDCLGSGDEIKETNPSPSTTTHKVTSKTTEVTTTTTRKSTIPTTTSTTTSEPLTPSHDGNEAYKMTGVFLSLEDIDLQYNELLVDPESELYVQYNRLIQDKMAEFLDHPVIQGKIETISILSFEDYYNFWYGKGVTVNFLLVINPDSSSNDVQQELNKISNYKHSFDIMPLPDLSFTATMPLPIDESLQSNFAGPHHQTTWWNIPQFGGSSFLSFPPINALTTLTINLRFRSFDRNGLLLLSVQEKTEGDFVSLAVREGKVEFRLDTGSGVLILKSNLFVNDSRWHDVLVRRNRREAMMKLDNKKPIQGVSPAGSVGLNTDSKLFVGGFNTALKRRIRKQVGVSKGLTGCVSSIMVQDQELSVSSENRNWLTSMRICECVPSPCFPNRCQNSANCFFNKLGNNVTARCECTQGFQGKYCQEKISPCAPMNCHPSSSCRVDPVTRGRHICVCAHGRSGPTCQYENKHSVNGRTRFMPGFAQDSYLIRKSMGGDVRSRMEIQVIFYSSHSDGLIFYNAQKRSGRGDFISLYLKKKRLFYVFDLGGGIVKIKSSPIELNRWHDVRLTRNLETGEMIVDGASPVSGKSPSGYSQLNLKGPLYLGGIPDSMKTPPLNGITIGLTGALQKFQVNAIDINLAPNENGYNVRQFNAHPCYHKPCRNRGTCLPQMGGYTCL